MKKTFDNDWEAILVPEFEKSYYLELRKFIAEQYSLTTVYPPKEEVMSAFYTVAHIDVKVVILGQDPYHGTGQAHGMSFSVKKGVPHPPSLRNIFKELESDIGCPTPKNGYLMKWAEQGVFLLNTVLTVRQGEANSHKGQGWEHFTDAVIESLAKREDPVIFVLWGKPAQTKRAIIEKHGNHHFILQAPHPSPLSAHRGFFGSKPFSKINSKLIEWGYKPIDWCLED
ncbi:uracil-DNA glycosylase [Ureibacillus chungkukjangi]|uniref:uracil-DNA glycosylase n=1 Tax=Ureibacillus chungkukjangi TaxID=1202712 RepID=UPI00203C8E69|nr:uracil-DNA glycosylase [Ureibacillus chungkukjangi]MCM3389559.1 uracil-DNA glycosylase [Ureibacillus chungkukjangi]